MQAIRILAQSRPPLSAAQLGYIRKHGISISVGATVTWTVPAVVIRGGR